MRVSLSNVFFLQTVPCTSMKNLLIVYHSRSERTGRMAGAAYEGARHEDVSGVAVKRLLCHDAGAQDLLEAHGLLLGTPENFGYMSGAMKDFFDRTFYAVEGKIAPLPYAVFISAGNDGTGALTAIRRIARGYPFTEVQEPVIARGELTAGHLQQCRDLGTALALGLEMSLF